MVTSAQGAPTVLIAGGGTGGHVYPMLAVGEAIERLHPGARVVYVGTGRGIETRAVPAAGGRLEVLDVLPLRGGGLTGLVRGLFRAAATLPAAWRLVRRVEPCVVFSVGGYAAGPVTLAARLCGVPVTLLEPNSVLGFTNRLLRRLVTRAYVCFPEASQAFASDDVRCFGVPLRRRFEAVPYPEADVPLTLLVLGGSQGAQAMNEAIPDAVAAASSVVPDLVVVHQTGVGKDQGVRARYAELGLSEKVTVVPFIDDVQGAVASAHVVISRAGAGTLAELCAIGRPILAVPYPYAADDHQRHNALSLAVDGAALCVPQPEATSRRLGAELAELFVDRQRREAMAAAAGRRGRPDAARELARDLLAIGGVDSAPEPGALLTEVVQP